MRRVDLIKTGWPLKRFGGSKKIAEFLYGAARFNLYKNPDSNGADDAIGANAINPSAANPKRKYRFISSFS